MSLFLKLVAWGLAAAVTYATLGPPGSRPHAAALGQGGEHALAFVMVGLAFGVAYTRKRWRTAAMVIGFTGLIEVLQFLAPGRHARLEDFLIDAFAAGVGLAAAALIVNRMQRSSTGAS
jgi:VanZ family protein